MAWRDSILVEGDSVWIINSRNRCVIGLVKKCQAFREWKQQGKGFRSARWGLAIVNRWARRSLRCDGRKVSL